MGNRQSFVVPLSVCVVCLVCVRCYRVHRALKSNILTYGELPGFVYLSARYVVRAVGRRPGCLYGAPGKRLHYRLCDSRLETHALRQFCGAAGYGADYPDSEYRDIPLCFPEVLCCRLMLLALTHDDFRLSPAGLVRVRQTLRTFQPIDELKKGPFTLQVQVLEYQQTDVGVEVDVRLSAASHCGSPVWESCVTLLSRRKLTSHNQPQESEQRESSAEEVKQVELSVPRMTGLSCSWSFSEFSPHRLHSVPLRFFGFRSEMTAGLWMLSICLAEIEKHKGVKVVTAPVRVSAHFEEPLMVPGNISLSFWKTIRGEGLSSAEDVCCFHMRQDGRDVSHVVGRIIRA
ncbi:uncharacterized protein LOC114469722 [Gouania willdenowi]|uniref:uncharacterized protein LOC114469722 n=1 Tax=Gouania willdenowi TaxID=441366 RepID=UPI0010569604|nr:uncharacterized protein LOC114469722 [Gouania willdenowi]